MLEKVGKFIIDSGRAIVSDPCYEPGTWCSGVIKNVQFGEWVGYTEIINADFWGARVTRLVALHSEYLDVPFNWKLEETIDVGVDSGQAGIFDAVHYENVQDRDSWREQIAHKIFSSSNKGQASCTSRGITSSSGFGDGGYPCHTIIVDGKVVGILIDFMVDASTQGIVLVAEALKVPVKDVWETEDRVKLITTEKAPLLVNIEDSVIEDEVKRALGMEVEEV